MTPERLQQIEEILLSVLERLPEERAAFLDEACGSDAELRGEIESLIVADARAGSFIESAALHAAGWLTEGTLLAAGQSIGPYKIIRELGHGGMGTVYLAARDDQQYQKQVAIKLVRRGLDNDFIVSRFRHERQIVASLDHPNIAQLYDGGTTENGLPYFVMEYIEGAPVDDYCDAHRLSITERLKLFRRVCSAIHYAHQHMIVHRDIKPGNILVTEDGTPKLLDFGIAKLLDSDVASQPLDRTATAVRLMTPDYASPEQVRGQSITTASDVYSLGVLLYELLTGHRPYRIGSRLPHEIALIVCEQEPEKPSTAVNRIETGGEDGNTTTVTPDLVSRTREGRPEKLRRRLRGDLDNIVLRAIRKEPSRRYASVEQLSDDIRRHLEGLPVIARGDTLAYRGAKFIRRHTAGVAAAALVVVALLAGIIISTWQARIAQRERAKAERRFNDVRALANSFLFEFHDSIRDLAGSTPAQQLVVTKALEYLDSLASEAGDDLSLMRELGTAYQKVAGIQGSITNSTTLGDSRAAIESYRRAIAIREAIIAGDPSDAQTRAGLAASYQGAADVMLNSGDSSGAIDLFQKVIAIRDGLSASEPGNPQTRMNLMIAYRSFYSFAVQQSWEKGIETLRKALDLNEELVSASPENAQFTQQLAVTLLLFGRAMWIVGEFEKSRESLFKSRTILEQWHAQEPTSLSAYRNLIANYTEITDMLWAGGDAGEELAVSKKLLTLAEAFAEKDPKNSQARRHLMLAYFRMARSLQDNGDFNSALAYYQKDAKEREQIAAANPTSTLDSRDLAEVYLAAAELLLKSSDSEAATEYANKARQTFEQLIEKDPNHVEIQRLAGRAFCVWAHVLAASGRAQAAREYTTRSLALKKAMADRFSHTGHIIDEYTSALLTCEPEDLRDPAIALSYATRAALATGEKNPSILKSLAQAYYLTGDHERAIQTAKNAMALLPKEAQRHSVLSREVVLIIERRNTLVNSRRGAK